MVRPGRPFAGWRSCDSPCHACGDAPPCRVPRHRHRAGRDDLGRRRVRVPGRQRGLSQLHRDGRGHRGRGGGSSRHRVALLDRQELPGPRAVGGQGLGPCHVDEREPEILFDGSTTPTSTWAIEMTLHILHWLVDGYGTDPRITTIVNTPRDLDRVHRQPRRRRVRHLRRQVPQLAQEPPAHARHDARSARTSTATTATAGAAAAARARTRRHHLPRAGRVLDARGPRDARLPRQPRRRRSPADPGRDHVPRVGPAGHVAVRLHDDRRPGRHDPQDHAALVALGGTMAARNGYRPEQASDLYISSGTSATASTATTGSSPTRSRCRVWTIPTLDDRRRDRSKQGRRPRRARTRGVPATG